MTADSRLVRPGFVFVAIAGTNVDGARFIEDAVSKGAIAVLASMDADVSNIKSIPILRVREPRRELALMAARFCGLQPETAVAVTGTSGKTSVVEFARQIFTTLGYRAASIGTIGLMKPDGSIYGALTTPDPVTLHETLAELADDGVTHVAFEASSHGLDQGRVNAVKARARGRKAWKGHAWRTFGWRSPVVFRQTSHKASEESRPFISPSSATQKPKSFIIETDPSIAHP